MLSHAVMQSEKRIVSALERRETLHRFSDRYTIKINTDIGASTEYVSILSTLTTEYSVQSTACWMFTPTVPARGSWT